MVHCTNPVLQRAPIQWSKTLRLPSSKFPARPILADQSEYLKRCTDDLYAWQRESLRSTNHPDFVLHDGPPYANGSLHIGHALNKILKDITNRVQVSRGRRVHYVPGWDCHGLPIELKALQLPRQEGKAESDATLGPVMVRKIARQLASHVVEEQKAGFREWGVIADWSAAWKTMDRDFEIRQLEVFKSMLERGLIYRRFKPIYWSPSSRTALAEAELEYHDDHISTATYVKFRLDETSRDQMKRFLESFPAFMNTCSGDEDISALIWTTTPWTLPANRMIAVNRDLIYTLARSRQHELLIIAESRVAVAMKAVQGLELLPDVSFPGSSLESLSYEHPLFGSDKVLRSIVHGDFVSAESGSGLVHCAPGHGMDDYKLGQKLNIDVVAPVDDEGRFTADVFSSLPRIDAELFTGKHVLQAGNAAVVEYLTTKGAILATERYKHKYFYDWRSKRPCIIRATAQWFANVEQIRDDTLRALENVKFIPDGGKERLSAFVKSRSEWCISRQRAWGVPIPALYHQESGEALLTPESVDHVVRVINDRGIDAWWTDDEFESVWVPPRHRNNGQYRRGRDTMDVWFDSGTSWKEMQNLAPYESLATADIYLEGSDQHRGWFQSSLLTCIANQAGKTPSTQPSAPYRTLITHGFTLDHQGKKMSKSEGNVISPAQIMDGTLLPSTKRTKSKDEKSIKNQPVHSGLGADALRLWVAGCDFTKDVTVSQTVLKAISGSLLKLRVTFKLLLGMLEDHDPTRKRSFHDLNPMDQIALIQLQRLENSVDVTFAAFEYHKAVSAISQYVNNDFSAFYVETVKDRIYAEAVGSLPRNDAQAVLWEVYKSLSRVLAPITPLLVEEAREYLPPQLASFHPVKSTMHESVRIPKPWHNAVLEADTTTLMTINSVVKALQEKARADKKMGSSLQSVVDFELPNDGAEDGISAVVRRYETILPWLLVVSGVHISGTSNGSAPSSGQRDESWRYSDKIEIGVEKVRVHISEPPDLKCSRCWRYMVGRHHRDDNGPDSSSLKELVCDRCVHVMDGMRNEFPDFFEGRPNLDHRARGLGLI